MSSSTSARRPLTPHPPRPIPTTGRIEQLPDPPTRQSLAEARRALESKRAAIHNLSQKIDAAEQALAEIIRVSRCDIHTLETERARLASEELAALAYLSPVRRLPQELVREIFMCCFDEHPCSAWILAAVSTSWRRLALRIPLLWSKIRLITTPSASADTIRLWLERSGDVVPLDIEIFLRVGPPNSHNHNGAANRRTTLSSSSAFAAPPMWPPFPVAGLPYAPPLPAPHPLGFLTGATTLNGGAGFNNTAGTTTTATASTGNTAAPGSGNNGNLVVTMPPSPSPHDPWNVQQTVDRGGAASKISIHWGHIAFFYLGQQMHRWERFVFRFDRQFTSMGALKSIHGDAPLLREFEVSSAEAGFCVEWPWLPNSGENPEAVLPNLRSVTLQHTPFKWSSPMLRNLEQLTLRAIPTSHLPLDRIQGILTASPKLKSLTLHFQGVLPPILTMQPLALPDLTRFSIGGHYLLTQLVDTLALPALTSLSIDIESRDPIEDTLSGLLTRSGAPPLSHLAIAYGSAADAGAAAPFYYGPGGIVISWHVLAELPHLRTLEVGGTPFESLLSALGAPDDEHNPLNSTSWVCTGLENLSMRHCHSHGDGIARLVGLVEARNPLLPASSAAGAAGGGTNTNNSNTSANGGPPVRLKRLELLECPNLGPDVVRWLASRVEQVRCTEPPDRSPIVHHPFM